LAWFKQRSSPLTTVKNFIVKIIILKKIKKNNKEKYTITLNKREKKNLATLKSEQCLHWKLQAALRRHAPPSLSLLVQPV
jgi:hypothetical protein